MEKLPRPIPTWCPGCDNYLVLVALRQALQKIKIAPKDTVVCFDIGCAGNMNGLLDVCSVETLHGRSIPVASGIKAVREDLTVIAQAGDGGLLNEGLNHFVHACRRDDDITVLVNNSLVFSLTAGQRSSATPQGALSRADQGGAQNKPLSVIDLAAISGATFISRIEASDPSGLQAMIEKAIRHHGFSVIEIIEPCKIWAKKFTQQKYKLIKQPFRQPSELIGKQFVTGLLYEQKR